MKLEYVLLFTILNMVIIYYVHHEGHHFYSDRIAKNKIMPKIYDIGHKYIPNLTSVKLLEILSNIIAFILPYCFGKDVAIEFSLYILPIILIRYIFICLTILPKDKSCNSDEFGIMNFITGHCYDKIFSGHFSSGILLSLILLNKGYNNVYLGIFNILNALLIISLRYHYTVDLIIAAAVVLLVYQNKLKINI